MIDIRERLINCLLINIHYMKIIYKKKPDWKDYTLVEKSFKEK